MQQSSIKIYISCHKECFVPKNPLLFPIQVGAAIANKRFEGILHDDDGENISSKNKMYCELTAQYWVWKNAQDADYVGFWHYRRYMSFAEKEFPHNPFEDVELDYLDESSMQLLNLKEDVMRNKINSYDVIATTPVALKKLNKSLKSNRHQYESTPYQYKEDLDVMLDIIKEKYPEYYDIANWYLDKSPIGYYCNMFIMKKELFVQYSEWLFTILFEHEKRRDYTNYDATGYRVSGYLGERLFAIWYFHLKQSGKYRTCDLQRTLFKNVEKEIPIGPAFSQNNVALALATDDYFAPYMAVTLKSIIDNSSADRNYDILVLSADVSEQNKTRILKQISGFKNFSIRFINPTKKIKGFTPYLHGHFGHIETYYRLILPELLPAYKKIIYLDSDMVIKTDIAELFEENIDGYMLAACNDADTAGLYNGYQKGKKDYMDKILCIKEPYKYFQAGTILFNLDEIRKAYSSEKILNFASKEKWELQDQDVLNKLCEGKVKYIDMSWNAMVDYGKIRISKIIALAPQWLSNMYFIARKNPKIIHYAGPEKPWIYPEMDFGIDFWEYARKTQFYEIILARMAHRASIDESATIALKIKDVNKKHNLVRRTFLYFKEYGAIQTIKKIVRKISHIA